VPWLSPLAPLAQPLPVVARAVGIDRRAAELADAVALTFDDGPHPQATPAVLEILRAHDVKATFFLTGDQIRATGALAQEIRGAGHAIAVHGDRHRSMFRMSRRAVAEDLAAAEQVIEPTIAVHRAPMGIYTGRGLAEVRARGWRPLLWSRDGQDWTARATGRSVLERITRGVTTGDVLLLHDADTYSVPGIHAATIAALPRVLENLTEKGLKFAIPA
jgi:peptidoglycan/xylan/chitin deacetylase (PgdA/CDA1 family)